MCFLYKSSFLFFLPKWKLSPTQNWRVWLLSPANLREVLVHPRTLDCPEESRKGSPRVEVLALVALVYMAECNIRQKRVAQAPRACTTVWDGSFIPRGTFPRDVVNSIAPKSASSVLKISAFDVIFVWVKLIPARAIPSAAIAGTAEIKSARTTTTTTIVAIVPLNLAMQPPKRLSSTNMLPLRIQHPFNALWSMCAPTRKMWPSMI